LRLPWLSVCCPANPLSTWPAKADLRRESTRPEASQQYGFSQEISTKGTTTVYLSGQVAWNARQEIVDALDLGAQTRRALENVEIAVRATGGTRTDIVCLRLYIVGEHIHNARSVREALLGFFPADKLPTSTWIGVAALASKDFLIEIEAIAVLE
jgi:enamine deaminase RidA (YjgF/YER057c/UK114 family)